MRKHGYNIHDETCGQLNVSKVTVATVTQFYLSIPRLSLRLTTTSL